MAKYKVLVNWGDLKAGETVELNDKAVIERALELKVIGTENVESYRVG